MAPAAAGDENPGHTATRDDPVSNSGVLEGTQSLLLELQGLIHDRFRLAALETRRAGESFVAMIVAGMMAAVLLSCTWLGLVAAVVLWLIENGVVASSALLLAVAFNLLLVLILCRVMRRKSRYLQFPATLRSLQPMPPRPRGHRRDDTEKS